MRYGLRDGQAGRRDRYQSAISQTRVHELPPPVAGCWAAVAPKAGAAPKPLVLAAGLKPLNGDDVLAPALKDPGMRRDFTAKVQRMNIPLT